LVCLASKSGERNGRRPSERVAGMKSVDERGGREGESKRVGEMKKVHNKKH
jgi:hypothetical protein